MRNLRRKDNGSDASQKLSRLNLNTRNERLVNGGRDSDAAPAKGVKEALSGAGKNARKAGSSGARAAGDSAKATGNAAKAGLHAGKSSFHTTRAGSRFGKGAGGAGKNAYSQATNEEDSYDQASGLLKKAPKTLKNAAHLPKKFGAAAGDIKAAVQETGKAAQSTKRAAGDMANAGKRVKEAAQEVGKGGRNLRTAGAAVRQRAKAKQGASAARKTGQAATQVGSQISRGSMAISRATAAVAHAIRAAVTAVSAIASSSPVLLTVVAIVAIVIVVIATIGWFLPGVEEERKRLEAPISCDNGINGQAVSIPAEYKDAVEKAAKTAQMPTSLIAAQIQQESNWNPKAVSPVGARGIAQFMPGTWEQYGNGKDPFDGQAGIDAQGRYMADIREMVSYLSDNEEEILKLSLAGYNAGPGAVQHYAGIPPFPETVDYVKIIMSAAKVQCENPLPMPLELGPGEWTNPMPGSRLTSDYGPRPCPLVSCAGMPFLLFHEGIDLAGGISKYFYAPTEMKITYVGKGTTDPLWDSYGEYIYAVQVEEPHLVFEFHEAAAGSLTVNSSNVGDVVPAGTPLGQPGATGNSSGRHLHFQINKPGTDVSGPTIQNGKSIDPLPYLEAKGITP